MATLVYILCTLSSAVCALLLWRGYVRSGLRLLFWSTLCFCILALANALLIVDLVVMPERDLSTGRTLITLFAMLILLYGLIFKSDQ